MFTIIGGDGKEYGPVSVEQIRAWITAGRANLNTQAKALGSDEWRRLGDYPEFAASDGVPPVMTVAATDLADRLYRLGAWFLDNVIGFLFCLPGLLLIGFSVARELLTGRASLDAELAGRALAGVVLLAIGGVALLVIQIWLLSTRGQTLGKRIVGVRIVNVSDGGNPGFVRAVLLRWFVTGLITFVLNFLPPLGFIFFLVDACFIFRDDRRCLHDLIAGTRVVTAETERK